MPDEPPNLPAVPGPAPVDEVVIDGIPVDDPPPRGPLIPAPVRYVAGHPHARLAARHLAYVLAGAVVLARRRHERRTRHERMARAAEAAGDHEVALKWIQQAELERKGRHDRRRATAQMVVDLAKASPWIAGALAASPGVLGVFWAIDRRNVAAVIDPYVWTAHAVALAVEVASVAWSAATFAVPLGILAWLHHLGRTAATMPAWMVTAADADVDIMIDERAVTQALEALRIPQVRDYLKQGIPLPYIVPCRIEGRGTYCELRLPKGVTTEEVGTRRAKLASALYRLPTEVWPSMGGDASHLRLWIADKGALAEGAGPYPLLEGGFTDVFKGLPFGRILRGDPSRIPVIGRNTMCGGIPEQGKSNGGRVVAAGYTLDIITEVRIWVPDTNFDFEPFAPRCSRYVMGAEDEHIERIMGDLEELNDELQRRGQLLVDYEVQEVTREIAHAGVGLHPVFCLLEEAHVAIQHHKHGKDIGKLLCDIVRLDRKRGVHLMVSTQAPTKDSIPRDVTRNCSNGIAFAVGDHVANDALLGQGAYRAGHRATELIPGTDRGTALCKGFSGERSEVVQVHRLDVKRDNDQVTPLVNRALAEMARKGRALPGTGTALAIEARDLLADLAEVTRDDPGRVNVAELPPRLRDLAKAWGPYKRLTGTQLADLLRVEGVRVFTTGGTLRVDPADLARAATGTTGATSAGQGGVEPFDD